jgi:hypothetical protein
MATWPRRDGCRLIRMRVSVQAGVLAGLVWATLDRSISPAGPSSCQRCHHFHAVVPETPISAATCAGGRPAAIRWTLINRPAGVSRALA